MVTDIFGVKKFRSWPTNRGVRICTSRTQFLPRKCLLPHVFTQKIDFTPKFRPTFWTTNAGSLPFTRAIQKDVWILSECFCTVWTVWRDFSSRNVAKIIRRSNARNTFQMSNTVFHFLLYQKWVKNLKKSKLKKKQISASWTIFKVCKNF